MNDRPSSSREQRVAHERMWLPRAHEALISFAKTNQALSPFVVSVVVAVSTPAPARAMAPTQLCSVYSTSIY